MPKENNYLVFPCDMNSGSILRIFKQDDGDVILSIYTPEAYFCPVKKEIKGAWASIEFCAPMTGGGQQERLWHTLAKFFQEEMAVAEEFDPKQRNPLRAD